MVSPRPGRKLCVFPVWLGLLGAQGVAAGAIELDVERVETPVGVAEGLALRVDWPAGAAAGSLELRIARLDTGDLGYRYESLRWQCPLTLDRATQIIACRGALRAAGAGRATLSAHWQAGEVRMELAAARGKLAAIVPKEAAEAVTVLAERMPAQWLQPVLERRWKQGKITAGTFDARLAIEPSSAAGRRLHGPIGFAALGFDSTDGRIAAASLAFDGAVDVSPGAQNDVRFSGKLRGGELLAGSLYAALPADPIGLSLSMRGNEKGWEVRRAEWMDPGVLELSASAKTDAALQLQSLAAEVRLPRLATAQPRYLESLLARYGLAGATLGGSAGGRFELREGSVMELDLTLADASLRDEAARFSVDALDGRLHWSAAREPVESKLRWRAARWHEVELGPATFGWRSSARSLALRAPSTIAVLGGEIELSRLAWQPAAGERGTQLDLSLALKDIDLARLSQAFGWPAFSGTLRGSIPGVRYANQVLSLDGTLSAQLFDGSLSMESMSLERPFGVAPTLSADIGFAALDLEPLTSAFGFGTITGRLDGAVRALRLVDWSPVAFDADLHTSPGVRGPRRISRRAVNDLTRVGGGGIAAGLQNQVLKLFETFGYARIGLTCRLAGNVCHMGGLDSSGGGYTIVEGSGLPRITVIGHQRQVDWPVLVARLKAATEGQAPIVQ